MTRKVVMYSKNECGQCDLTRRELNRKSVEFEEIKVDVITPNELAESIRERAKEKGINGSFPYVTVHDESNNLIADWFGFIPDNINAHAAVSDQEDAA